MNCPLANVWRTKTFCPGEIPARGAAPLPGPTEQEIADQQMKDLRRDSLPARRPGTGRTPVAWRLRLHEVVFEADTPAGRAFDIALIVSIFAKKELLLMLIDRYNNRTSSHGCSWRTYSNAKKSVDISL